MSRNGSGTYSLPAGNPVVTGTTISSTWANTTLQNIADALTQSIAADGQTPLTGNLNANTNKIIDLAPGTQAGDAVEYSQFIAASGSAVDITGGTINGTTIGATTPSTGRFTTLQATSNVTFSGTGFLLVPKGTTAERPVSPVNGELRYNTDTSQFEGYQGGAWGQLGGGATGGGGDEVFVLNSRVVTADYTFPTGKSGESVGPVTISSGISVTIPADERWVVL